MKMAFLALLTISAGGAQMLPPGRVSPFPAQLGEYLGLTTTQIESINRLNMDYYRYTAEKQMRTAQVQRELAVEMARPQLDPMALGLRYMELETIRREIDERLKKTRGDVAATLTDAQKTRLKALEDAARLQPLISQAQCENLLAVQPFPGNIIPASRTGDFTFMPIPAVTPTVACGAVLVRDPMPLRPAQ